MNSTEYRVPESPASQRALTPPAAVDAALDTLAATIEAAWIGAAIDAQAFTQSLACLAGWRGDEEEEDIGRPAGQVSRWTVHHFGAWAVGGTLVGKTMGHELLIGRDPDGHLCLGLWRSTRADDHDRSCSFIIEEGPGGARLMLDNGCGAERKVDLPGAGRPSWGSLQAVVARFASAEPAVLASGITADTEFAAPAPAGHPAPPRFCGQCGARVGAVAHFCHACGTALSPPTTI